MRFKKTLVALPIEILVSTLEALFHTPKFVSASHLLEMLPSKAPITRTSFASPLSTKRFGTLLWVYTTSNTSQMILALDFVTVCCSTGSMLLLLRLRGLLRFESSRWSGYCLVRSLLAHSIGRNTPLSVQDTACIAAWGIDKAALQPWRNDFEFQRSDPKGITRKL